MRRSVVAHTDPITAAESGEMTPKLSKAVLKSKAFVS